MKSNRQGLLGAAIGAVLGGFIFGLSLDKILLGAIAGALLGSFILGWKGLWRAVIGAVLGGIISGLALYPFLKPEHKSADLERLTFYIFGVGLSMLVGAGIGAAWRTWPKT
jgi:ABC-type enterobactin transport system permease subunit